LQHHFYLIIHGKKIGDFSQFKDMPPTDTPTTTPPPEPIIKYVLAAANREFNCDFTSIYGTVLNANNFGLPNVEVRALGIHETSGLDFTVTTDAEGRYEAFRLPLADLPGAQWAMVLMGRWSRMLTAPWG
jgi:hypothetical protein